MTTNTDEVCVFCHTPHQSQTQTAIAAPLWNKGVPDETTFTTYDSTTIDGTILTLGSVSIACLSCHDGSQAMDVVINAPGSRGVTPTVGAEIDPLAIGLIGVGNTAADLGKDLTNDHPIGVQYGGFNPGTGQIDPDFAAGAALQTANINGQDVWWINAGAGPATRDKNDVILYTRLNGATPQPFVECGSCHDPHQGTALGVTTAGSEVNFMRVANTGSTLCLTCHVK